MTDSVSPAFETVSFPAVAAGERITNALSVDVEDYFQVQALAGWVERDSWDAWPLRVAANTHRLLDLFAAHRVTATFFALSWIAERSPALIQRIVAEGHELASHGSDHRRVDQQTPEAFRQDVRRSKAVLEEIGGTPVRGYRAPTFSINATNLWAFDILDEEGYAYSSSVYPVRRDYYGMPSAPRFPFLPRPGRMIRELPLSTVRLAGRNLPCGGGGFFRLLPFGLSRAAIAHVNRVERRPCIFYIHPWEIDPGQPRIAGLPWRSRIRTSLNLDKTHARLDRLLTAFDWARLDRVFLSDSSRRGHDDRDSEIAR